MTRLQYKLFEKPFVMRLRDYCVNWIVKTIFLAMLFTLLISSKVNAQQFKRLRIPLGFGYAFMSGNEYYPNNRTGILLSFEPSININDRLNIGIRLETQFTNFIGSGFSINSYGFNGQYYFSKKAFVHFWA